MVQTEWRGCGYRFGSGKNRVTPATARRLRSVPDSDREVLSAGWLSVAFVSYLVLRISDKEHALAVCACYGLTLDHSNTPSGTKSRPFS